MSLLETGLGIIPYSQSLPALSGLLSSSFVVVYHGGVRD